MLMGWSRTLSERPALEITAELGKLCICLLVILHCSYAFCELFLKSMGFTSQGKKTPLRIIVIKNSLGDG